MLFHVGFRKPNSIHGLLVSSRVYFQAYNRLFHTTSRPPMLDFQSGYPSIGYFAKAAKAHRCIDHHSLNELPPGWLKCSYPPTSKLRFFALPLLMNFPFRFLFSWCRTCPLTTVTVAGLSAQRGVDAKCIFMFTVMWSSCKLYAPEVRPGLFGCQIALEVYTVRSVVPLMRTPFLRTRDWRSSHSIITIVRGKGYFVKNTRMRHGSSKDDKSGDVIVRPSLIEWKQKAFTAALAMRWGGRRAER